MMNDEKEGRIKLQNGVIEENNLNILRFKSLNFLNDAPRRSLFGEHTTINIVQLAKKNLEQLEKIKMIKTERKKISSNLKSLQINNESKSLEKHNSELNYETIFSESNREYNDFVERVMKRINKEKKLNIKSTKEFRKEIPNNNEIFFNRMIRQKKRNKKIILSKACEDLKKISFNSKTIYNSNDNFFKLPIINQEMKFNKKSRNHNFNNTMKKTSFINLYQQVLNSTIISNQSNYFPQTENYFLKNRHLSNLIK